MYKVYFNHYNNKYILFNCDTRQYSIVSAIDAGIKQRAEFINFTQNVELIKQFVRV